MTSQNLTSERSMNDSIKLPPHSAEAEQSVLGGLLLDNNAWDKIAGQLVESDFYRQDHRLIYRHIAKLLDKGLPADVITLSEAMEANGELRNAGGITYLGALAQNTPSAANIRRYAELVKHKANLRALITITTAVQDACFDISPEDISVIVSKADNAMAAILSGPGGDPVPLDEVMSSVIRAVDDRARNPYAKPTGIMTGFRELDGITAGFEPGQLIIAAGRPGMGKTIFGCNLADHAAEAGISTAFFTLEMTKEEIGQRILAARSGVPSYAMRSGKLDGRDWERISNQRGKSSGQPLFIDDTSAIGVSHVRAKSRQIQRRNGLGLIVIDYLGLMRGQGDNRTQEIGSISRGLKALAKELRVPIVCLAQLNRALDTRADKRPQLSDLRDSGEIEQDADIVLMIHQESAHTDSTEWQGIVEILVRKNRNGPLGEVQLSHRSEIFKFQDLNGPPVRRQQAKTKTHGIRE